MRRLLAALPFFASACGPAAPAEPARPATVQVLAADPAPEPAASGDAPRTASAGPSCVEALRRAADLPAGPDDRAIYDRAFALEQRGELAGARKQYFELVKSHPTSRLVPLAYLAFGELFANDAATDASKWELARAAYAEVVKYPPPDNVAYAYATLRLGDTRRERDDAQALSSYKKALEAVQQHPSLPCGAEVRQGAEGGLLDAYLRAGQPERAWVFFHASAGDERARALFAELCARYEKAGKPADACAAARAAGADATAAELARRYCR